MLLVVEPASRVLDTTRPGVDTVSIDLIFGELAFKEAAIGAGE